MRSIPLVLACIHYKSATHRLPSPTLGSFDAEYESLEKRTSANDELGPLLELSHFTSYWRPDALKSLKGVLLSSSQISSFHIIQARRGTDVKASFQPRSGAPVLEGSENVAGMRLNTGPPAVKQRNLSSTRYSGPIDQVFLESVSVLEGGRLLQGVHADLDHSLAARVLDMVPELADWESWYAPPPALTNGHVHTILAAKLRKTRAVKYHRELLITPDGGTLALDSLVGMRRARSGADGTDWLSAASRSFLSSGAVAGANEDAQRSDTLFVDRLPPRDPNRPLLMLLSGLGGGSQDTYVRSMAATAAERGWQVVVLNMRACGSSPVTSPRLFSARLGANDDVRFAVQHLRRSRLGNSTRLAVIGWSNSGTILNNVLAEQATTHTDQSYAIDAGVSLAAPLDMPASNRNIEKRPFHRQVYDRNLGKSLRNLWMRSRSQFVDSRTDLPIEVPLWDGLGEARGTFTADDELAKAGTSIRELDEALTRRQYGFASVDDYYADASSDQRLGQISTPLLCMNAYDDPMVPGSSLARGLTNARGNPNVIMAITLHGGHLGWCDPKTPWGSPSWIERTSLGFLEAVLDIKKADSCEIEACEIFD